MAEYAILHMTLVVEYFSEFISNASDICVVAFVSSLLADYHFLRPAVTLPRLAYFRCLKGMVMVVLLGMPGRKNENQLKKKQQFYRELP